MQIATIGYNIKVILYALAVDQVVLYMRYIYSMHARDPCFCILLYCYSRELSEHSCSEIL